MTRDGLKKELSGFTKDELLEAFVDSAIKGGDSGWYSFSDFKENLKRIHRENAIRKAESEKDRANDELDDASAQVRDIVEKAAAKIGKKPEEVTLKDMMDDSELSSDYIEKRLRSLDAVEKYRKACNRYIDTLSGEEREIPNSKEEKED